MAVRRALLAALALAVPATAGEVAADCTLGGLRLAGRVQVVTAFPDITVQAVQSFPDLRVLAVAAHPDDCGEWQFVESFPDFTIQHVGSFPDLRIMMVTAFPGRP